MENERLVLLLPSMKHRGTQQAEIWSHMGIFIRMELLTTSMESHRMLITRLVRCEGVQHPDQATFPLCVVAHLSKFVCTFADVAPCHVMNGWQASMPSAIPLNVLVHEVRAEVIANTAARSGQNV